MFETPIDSEFIDVGSERLLELQQEIEKVFKRVDEFVFIQYTNGCERGRNGVHRIFKDHSFEIFMSRIRQYLKWMNEPRECEPRMDECVLCWHTRPRIRVPSNFALKPTVMPSYVTCFYTRYEE